MILTEILIEYGLVCLTAVLLLYAYPRRYKSFLSDDLFTVLVISLILQILIWGVMIFSYVINPIRVLIMRGESIREIQPEILGVLCYILVALPIPFAIPFGIRLYRMIYKERI